MSNHTGVTLRAACAALISLGVTAAAFAQQNEPVAATTGSPLVTISKSCPSLRYLGRDATFEIVVTNRGDAPAYNVVVTDKLSGTLEFRSADNNGTRQGNTITWRIGTLAAGESRTLKAVYRCNRIGKVKNRATVSYCAEAAAECELDVQGIPAILLECVDDPDPIELNGTVTYTITVTNQGSAVGTGIEIVCALPSQQELVRADGPTESQTNGQQIRFAPLASLAPKQKATYRVQVRGVGEGDVRFRVEMTSDQTETPVMETESTRIYR